MQIDFHHAVTYVIARFAEFSHEDANIISYSAQYVDDATNSGTVKFDNLYMYNRISSAHHMLDYRNSEELANHQVWIPFHFLPGNNGKPAGDQADKKPIEKLVCCPNSYVAQDMVKACIQDRDKKYGLHLLGITMHVYADTWAHQGFAGINHEINDISKIEKDGKLDTPFMDKMVSFFVGNAMPLGHGAVLSYPDRPYLKWGYYNKFLKKKVIRNNPKDFLDAADHMCKAMQRWIAGDPDLNVAGLSKDQKTMIDKKIRGFVDEDGEDRHDMWLEAIKKDEFKFGAENLVYIPKGRKSWKHQALATKKAVDLESDIFHYNPDHSFLKSDWKRFHDALQAHRFRVLHEILPKYNICAA